MNEFTRRLAEQAAEPYRKAGRFAWHFARGKLMGDPLFAGVLEHGLIRDHARILDVGCGQGLMASWLLSAGAMQRGGAWHVGWPDAPHPASIHGIDLNERDVRRAQTALSGRAEFTVGDMRTAEFRQADVVLALDVLHYVDEDAQDMVLWKIRDALAPDGVLLLRVGDADGGLPFKLGMSVDRVVNFLRTGDAGRLHCRSLAAWKSVFGKLGFAVRSFPMSQGTPFANILLAATREASSLASIC